MSPKYIRDKNGKFAGSVSGGRSVPKPLQVPSMPQQSVKQRITIWVCALCETDYTVHPGRCVETSACVDDEGASLEEQSREVNAPAGSPVGAPLIKQLVRMPSNRPCENCTAERAVRGYDLCDDCDDALDYDYQENGFTSVDAYAASMGVRAQPRPKR